MVKINRSEGPRFPRLENCLSAKGILIASINGVDGAKISHTISNIITSDIDNIFFAIEDAGKNKKVIISLQRKPYKNENRRRKNFFKVLILENIEFRLQDFLFVHRRTNSRTSMIKFFPRTFKYII